jgi:uncharacterized damage-inducible protein DinB
MAINEAFIAELKQESAATRKLLERVPMDKAGWAPHAKSMKLGNLANHVSELLGWTMVTLDQDGIDFATMDYKPEIPKSTEELVKKFDTTVEKAIECLTKADDARFMENWTMRNGEKVLMTMPKAAVLRSFTFNHSYHHRAQLGMYLRLLDIPVPGTYGPSADEPNM